MLKLRHFRVVGYDGTVETVSAFTARHAARCAAKLFGFVVAAVRDHRGEDVPHDMWAQ